MWRTAAFTGTEAVMAGCSRRRKRRRGGNGGVTEADGGGVRAAAWLVGVVHTEAA